jgi:ACS family glucarate transporter-like MFS transporter
MLRPKNGVISEQPQGINQGNALGSPRFAFVLTLSCFSLVGYMLRMNVSIAAVFLVPELHLTTVQLGHIFNSFLVGYTVFQLPWGIWGDRFGARYVLCIAALIWGFTSVLTGLLPGLILSVGTTSVFVLLLLRFLLGVGEAAGFPVAARAIASSVPKVQHGLGYAAVIAGTAAGSALTPPLISRLMISVGWRASFYITACFAFVLAPVWLVVSSGRAHLAEQGRTQIREENSSSWHTLLRTPSMLNLSLSYFFESYALYVFVFWSYLYLVEQRHFTLLRGGVYTGLPFLVALFAVLLVGYTSDRLTKRLGYAKGRRNFAIVLMTLSAAFLFLTVRLDNAYLVVGALSLSVACLLSTECIFWSSSIEIGNEHAGAAGAIMNTAGNIGGIVSTALVPVLLNRYGWNVAFGSSSALVFISALLWLRVRPRRD